MNTQGEIHIGIYIVIGILFFSFLLFYLYIKAERKNKRIINKITNYIITNKDELGEKIKKTEKDFIFKINIQNFEIDFDKRSNVIGTIRLNFINSHNIKDSDIIYSKYGTYLNDNISVKKLHDIIFLNEN